MKEQYAIVLAAAVLTAGVALARTDYLTLPAGRSEVVDVGFAPKGRKIIGKELVTVTLREGATTATVTAGETQGSCQVEFIDAGGGEGLLLNVEVVGDLDDTLRALRKWLADFNDLEFVKGKSKIAITGTIGTPGEWAKFQKICALSDFKGKIESVVEFSVDPATIQKLRKEFLAEGLPLVDAGKRPGEGEIAMDYEHNVLKLTGSLYSQGDIDKMLRILKGQSWLEIVNGAPKDAATSTMAQAVVNVSVDDALLEMGVAFLLVSKKDVQQRKNTGRILVEAVWDGIKDLVLVGEHRSSQHGSYDNVRISSDLKTTINLLAEDGITRQREYGTFRFHANGDPGKTLHIGGSMKVSPPASGEGEAPEAQDYDYGFKIINKNSRRIGADTAEADIEIELNGVPVFQNDGGAVTVNQQRRSVSPLVRVPMGQTVAVAGYESLFENSLGPSGTPLLRNIPIVNWFVSDKEHKKEDLALLFLVSVRKVDLESEAPMVPNTPMKDITVQADTSTEELAEAERSKKSGGRSWWNPLSWFRW